MNIEIAIKAYLPMSETMYYILLSLTEERHGYGIMQHVERLTEGRIKLGAGTIYNSLSKLEKDRLIKAVAEDERRKIYVITGTGRTVLGAEIKRLKELYENGKEHEGV
ncbi:MAG: PadR family transcriptional regulator [Clostridia bacterium]|nr:PadR family transcriptional regulator [Clostridia bacterium]